MSATGADAPAASEAKIDGASFWEPVTCDTPAAESALLEARTRFFELTGSGSPESRIEGRGGCVEETFPAGAARSFERAGVESSSSARAANEIAAGSSFTGGGCTDLGTTRDGNVAATADRFKATLGFDAGLGEDFGEGLLAVFFPKAGLVGLTTTTAWGTGTEAALGADFAVGGIDAGTGFGATVLVAVFASDF